MKKAIECMNYSFRYARASQDVLEHCNLTLHYGEFMVLSGLSGEGKSTLLAAINGAIPHFMAGEQEGEIRLDGQPAGHLSLAARSRLVGSVLQNADHQIIHDRVEDEIAFGCENLAVSPDEIHHRISRVCQLLQLEPGWPTRTLSGGQKQRLITASTLAMNQRILIFDEPLANIDPAGARVLLQTLRRLADQGHAILFIEHRLDMVMPYADTVAWLEGGQVHLVTDPAGLPGRQLEVISDEEQFRLPPGPVCIEVENLTYRAGGRLILDDISLSLNRGERLVILGENGSGKTTLLQLLAGLLRPAGGVIRQRLLANRKMGSPAWFRKAGYVYQDPNYQLFMAKVSDEIGYQSARQAWTEQVMAAYDLQALADFHPQSLSEGQKRRVSIAAIQSAQPDLLLLDEPTVGQDMASLKRLIATLNQDHRERQTTMVSITHDYRCASALADRAIWIEEGRLFRTGGKELIDTYFSGHYPAGITPG